MGLLGLSMLLLMMLPPLLTLTVQSLGWRRAYLCIAIALGLCAAGLLLIRDSPASVGQRADGDGGAAAPDAASSTDTPASAMERSRSIASGISRLSERPSAAAAVAAVVEADAPPLRADSLSQVAKEPLFWLTGLLQAVFGCFWAGFNLTALDVVATRSDVAIQR